MEEIRIDFGNQVILTVPVTQERIRDVKDCKRLASLPGDGACKDCKGCSMAVEILDYYLCELPVYADALLARPE